MKKFAENYLTIAFIFNPLNMLILYPIYGEWISGLSTAAQLCVLIAYGIIDIAAMPVYVHFGVPDEKTPGLTGHRGYWRAAVAVEPYSIRRRIK